MRFACYKRDVKSSLSSLVAMALLAGLCASPARAGKWPTPVLGPSASGDPEVLFTFDDGPDEQHTEAILDTLAERHITAIFFWVGRRIKPGKYLARRQALVARALQAGHVIANHTVNHAQLCMVDKKEAAREIDDNEAMFTELTQMPIRLFRAPYGSKCKRLDAMLAERGLAHFHWDLDPQEWVTHDADATLKYFIRKLTVLQGRAVILMHDTHKVSARALPKILSWIDQENARRRDKGGKQIRILDAATVASERLAPGINGFLQTLRAESEGTVAQVLATLIPG